MDCKKCKGPGAVVLRKTDSYCKDCFLTNTNHKFRACIGKNKILSKNENVLVCLSGGTGSAVLMDLIFSGMSMESHKKLRITPFFLHLIEDNTLTQADNLLKQCNSYNFKVYLVHIAQYFEDELELIAPNTVPTLKNTTLEQYQTLLKTLSSTASKDLIAKIKRNLFIKFAEKIKCRFIFNAETTTTLAKNLLSNLALGRGSQVQNDVSFSDERNSCVKILRPMKDISHEELMNYIEIKQLHPICCPKIEENNLQSVIEGFVIDLQENFPATISTVCKTADKIGAHDNMDSGKKCALCESDLGTQNSNLTAFEATQFSRMVSNTNPQVMEALTADVNLTPLFPHIGTQLCYCCSRSYSTIDKGNLPNHVQKIMEDQ